MNQIIISRLFNVDEYFLFSRGGACPQDGWVNDETGEPVAPPEPDALVDWETIYGYNTPVNDVETYPVKVFTV